ncbi:MAG TPA: DUF4870 domain-containing protein [Dehalococcoidia bacterium]|nr:DUF4870 domain-containing protein [Dehalococcoidia bacterium]
MAAEEKQPQKTSLGIDQNIEGALCYIFGWVTGIVFLLVEKENRFVRFHAMQSIVTFVPLSVAYVVLTFIPIIGWILLIPLWIITVILWIVLMVMAVQGKQYKLPIAGPIAESQLKKTAA